IKDYGKLTARLNSHRNDKSEIEWTEDEKQDFNKLKEAFRTRPVRGFPDYENESPFVLDTDWSSINMAAVLSQVQDGKEKFLGCVAKKCNTAEQNYHSSKGELAAVVLGLKKFEHILRAKPFIIRTDSKCVEYLYSIKDARGLWHHWLTFISSFEFTTVHRAGTKQLNADALSRMEGLNPKVEKDGLDVGIMQDIADIYAIQTVKQAVSNQPSISLSAEDVARESHKDLILGKILRWVTEKYRPNKEDRKILTREGLAYANELPYLEARDNCLYRRVLGEDQTQLCLPPSFWDRAYQACHNDDLNKHMGLNATLSKVKQRFYWPGQRTYVIQKVASCLTCLKKNKATPSIEHQMFHEYTSFINQRLCMDTVGPLNKTKYKGQMVCHILTMQDSFSRFLVAIPVPDLEAKTLAQHALDHWILIHGVPEQIHTDRGTSFTSVLFAEIMSLLGIKK
ncbi:MAG: RNase H-like domain-containing protein, partial [Cyanobacteria bacterium J06553_1]